jgi:Sulfotransferase domain
MMPTNAVIKRLIFVHLGRTGGTTMRWEVFYKCVDRKLIYAVDTNEPPTLGGTVEQLLAMPRKEQEKLRIIVGHMPFGLREQLPWPETWHYVTLVRDPMARALSDYYQARHSETRNVHDLALRCTLEEYIRSGEGLTFNGMCQLLSNEFYGTKFENPEAMFLEALKNAKDCSFIGLTEAYDESLRRLCRLCGWEVPPINPRNVLTPKNLVLSDSERGLLRASNAYDLILYEHCRRRFAQPVAESRTGPLGKLLAHFRTGNHSRSAA